MNILVTGARAPIAADLVKAFARDGHRVWVADCVRNPVGAASPFVQGLLTFPAPRTDFPAFAAELSALCLRWSIDAIVPTSEEVFWLAGAASHLPASVDLRTSALATLSRVHHKLAFAQLVAELGYGAAENHEVASESDLARLGDLTRFVLKPVYSRFATETILAPSVRRVARLRPTRDRPWLAQSRVHGRELCAYNVAEAGRLLLHVAYEPMVRFGTGASVYFAPVHNEPLRTLCERVVDVTGFTGQISFDVMDTGSGLVALECNPRGTSGVHLAVQQPSVLAAALLGRGPPNPVSFVAEPRMLSLPLLFSHPGLVLRADGRRLLRQAKDALKAAGIPIPAQARALAEMGWSAARMRMGIARASTADIEWNGEPIHG